LAATLALGLIDYVIRYTDRGLRIMATAALAAAAAWASYRWWYVPSRARLAPLSVARRIEAQFPFLGDSLASAIEFLGQSEDDPTAGSAQLRRQVIATAETAVDHLPLDEVIDRRPLRRAATWLAAAALALAVCLAIDAGAVGTALVRLAAPFGATQWPREHHLAFRDLPTLLAAGQPFEVELIDESSELPDEVRIEYRTTGNGRRQHETEKMTRVGDMMVARRENVGAPFAFRAVGGDDDTMPWHEVTVVEPPGLESMDIVIHPPAYTGLPAEPAERHLEVLAGTGIEVRGTASEPLSAARILRDGDQSIDATIGPHGAGNERRTFHIAPDQWRADKASAYRVELADADGVAGVVGQWNLRVQPDPPPTIAWQWPNDDLFVTQSAIVPIELAVKDKLAIHTVELIVRRPGIDEGTVPAEPEEQRMELFRGPDQAVAANDAASGSRGDNRTIEHTLNVAAMNVPVGMQLTLQAEASDYRPGTGRTVAPRRITIITADELEARLADRQAQIVRQLEQALATERTTREDTRRLEIQQRDAGALTAGDRNTLQSVDLNQRRVGQMLVDPAEGVPALIDALITELDINQLPSSDTRATMRELAAALDRLAAGPLPTAESELISARKTADAPTDDNAALLTRSLVSAGSAQDQVIDQLEQLLNELGGWNDFRRFVRQLAELRHDQIVHEKTSRAEIGLETLPLDVRELSRTQRASLNSATASQDALARRYEKIEQGMDTLVGQLADKDATAAGTLADAVALARQLTIGANIHEAARDLSENRVGVALERESKIAADLEQVLDVLRNRSEDRLDELVDKLRQTEERLARLRQQAAQLREQIQRAEQQGGNADPRQLQELRAQQEQLRREAEQLARQLDRLQAEDAGRSTQSAANRLNSQPQDGSQNAADQRPSSSDEVKKAEEELAKAAEQLAERRQQAELDLALEFVRRFQAELQDMIGRQQSVIRDTAALDKTRAASTPLTPDQSQRLKAITDAERELAGLAREHSEVLFGLGAVRESLEDATRRLNAAAEVLATENTGTAAQQAEERALERLAGMLEAFAQTAAEAGGNQGGGGQGGQGGEQRRPTFELLEVKMLRMLQVDLNERTSTFQQRLDVGDQPADPQAEAALQGEAQELAAEQRRLAGLVEEMLNRDNEKQQE
jgi:uncharacterized protein YdcH (DUF465 family)